MKYCTHCGKEIDDAAVICVHCGAAVAPMQQPTVPAFSAFSSRSSVSSCISAGRISSRSRRKVAARVR